jgi:hypothetical protein
MQTAAEGPLSLSIYFSPQPQPGALFTLAEQAIEEGAQSLLLLAADANNVCADEVDPWLQQCPVPVFGGIFPQLIHQQCNHTEGYLVVGLSRAVQVFAIPGLSDPNADHVSELERQLGPQAQAQSVMLLVDGMATGITGLLDGVYDLLGSQPTFYGGGAGSLSFEQRPCLFFNRGLLADHAQFTVLDAVFSLAVEHGWEKFAGPFVVTTAEATVVSSLDWKPAFTLYRELVEADSGLRFEQQDFFAIAKGYPFGMERSDGQLVVRDPITRDGEQLICVGEVPVNSVVYLLKGRHQSLIAAAEAGARSIDRGQNPVIIIDCISRVLYLGEDFVDELRAVSDAVAPRPMFGMLTLGEIANGGDHCLEFYNKTLVLAAMSD